MPPSTLNASGIDMNEEPREPTRLPVRGTIAAVGTVGALALLLSFRGGPLAPGDTVTAQVAEGLASDELIVATASETSGAGAVVESLPPVAEIVTDAPAMAEVRTATGDAVSIRWGDVQVAVTVQAGDIIEVETLAMPMDDRRSQRINAGAEPVLREEAITYDTADVSVISGATYTSRAYATSLQSALDQVGF